MTYIIKTKILGFWCTTYETNSPERFTAQYKKLLKTNKNFQIGYKKA
jgi:hypothetical protein